jgi:hypothetical protein
MCLFCGFVGLLIFLWFSVAALKDIAFVVAVASCLAVSHHGYYQQFLFNTFPQILQLHIPLFLIFSESNNSSEISKLLTFI